MKVILESTARIVTIKGLPARVWQGETAQGIPCHAYITRIAVERSEDAAEFEAALQETAPLTAERAAAIPARLVLPFSDSQGRAGRAARGSTEEDPMTPSVQVALGLLGQRVRWAHEPAAAPAMRVTAVQHDGMVALDIFPGWFG